MPTTPTKVAFLIDEQSLMREDGITLEQLKLSIMRTLIFYHSQLEPQEILWGYRFFSTQTRYASESIRHFYSMTEESFYAIEAEYRKRENDRQTTSILGTPIMRIKQVLKEAIGDFQWENTDLCTTVPVKHYMYLLTDCPTNTNELHHFFVSPNEEGKQGSFPALYRPYFQQTKEDLVSTLSQSYTQRQISLSIVNTRFQFKPNNPMEQLTEQIIRQGFTSCSQQFDGNYIVFKLLIRNYNVYGHSFVSEFANILPHAQYTQPVCQIPVWKGPFKTKLGKSLGNFALFPSIKNKTYQANTLAFISEIRTRCILHASQFSPSWLLKDNPVDPGYDYKLTYEPGESPHLINAVLDELFSTQSVLIAELVPMAGYEELCRKVCIEPFSRSSASLRFLNIQDLPNTIRLNQVVMDEEYPIGSFITGTRLSRSLPKTSSPETRHLKLSIEVPSFIKKMLQSKKSEALKGKRPIRSIQPKKEEHVEKIIQLPTSVHMMEKELKKLYLEMLYTQNDTIENTLVIIDQWINHLLKTNSEQDVASALFDKTMQFEDLDEKHRNEIPYSHQQKFGAQVTLEQTYLREWWDHVKNRGSSDAKFEKMSCIVLKLKEARLQVILYCFIARLMTTLSESSLKRDPFHLAEKFFKKTVLTYALNDITDFLQEIDSEDGSHAVKRRDPADLNDYVFMQLLEKCFTDLPDLTSKFRENVGMDDMAASPSPASPLDEDDDLDEFVQPKQPQRSIELKRPAIGRSQSDYFQTRRAKSDMDISKPDRKLHTTLSSLSKYSKPLLPIPIQRSNSNSTLDGLQKRMVSVTNKNTKATDVLTKLSRSAVDDRPQIKRAGSFTRSAHSPKRTKTSASMLSNDKTGTTVILRRTDAPDPKTTPRTSLNRHLGTNLFTEYSETCLSPSSKTSNEDIRPSQEFLQSEYPSHTPQAKTPQGTANRFRRIMNLTPHRDEIELAEDELSVQRDEETQQQPPYTPRTAAKRAKDRIDRSQISVHPGRDLTSRLQNIFDEEKQDKPFYKQKHFLLEGDDENVDPFSDNDSSSSRPVMNRTTSLGDTRKVTGWNFEEDSDSDSDNESSMSLQMDTLSRNYLF